MLLISSYLLLVLTLYSRPEPAHGEDAPVPKIGLRDKSYILDLTIINGDAGNSFVIEEMHSAWQKRSKVHFETYGQAKRRDQKNSKAKTFYADPMVVLAINSQDTITCLEVGHDYVDKMFNQNILMGFESSHLIGAARLLSFVDQNHDKFFMLTPRASQDKDPECKLMFGARLKFDGGGDGEFRITLCYHDEPAKNLANGIPRMIIIGTRSEPTIYRFTRYQPLEEGRFRASSSSIDSVGQYRYNQTDEVALDLFALDPLLGCSRVLVANQPIRLEQFNSHRFSFTARPPSGQGSRGFPTVMVIYEPNLASLRIDEEQPNEAFVSKIVDLSLGVQYHIVRENEPKVHDQPFARVLKAGKDYSCVVSQVESQHRTANHQTSPLSLGRMLFGSEKLAYLGLARVRGIEARVYESYDSVIPIWLESPVVYEQAWQSESINASETKAQVRDERQFMGKRKFLRRNLFYFANTNSPEHDILSGKLLLAKMYAVTEWGGKLFAPRPFSVYDFSWDLPSSSSARGRYEDSFSLQGNCVAADDNAEYATIDLLLEAHVGADEQEVWLKNRAKRNLALLQVARSELGLNPVAMINDLESRLAINNEETSLQDSYAHLQSTVSLAVSMRVAERIATPTRLLYRGLARLDQNHVKFVEVNGFQACHMLAAHQKIDGAFGYRMDFAHCYLIDSNIWKSYDGDLRRLGKNEGDLQRTSLVEVWEIRREEKSRDQFSQLAFAKDVLMRKSDLQLNDPSKYDPLAEKQIHSLKLDIKSFHVNLLNEELRYDLNDPHLSGTSKFRGLGLVASDDQNKLVKIKKSHVPESTTHVGKEMSFEHCQTACLADFECRSFSVCIERGEMRCVLSKVSFATPSMATQLMLLMEKKAKLGEKFQVNVDLNEQNYSNTNSKEDSPMETIQLVSHRNCELHNKLYRNLFEFTGKPLMKFKQGMRAVARLEHCAELCFRKTLDSFEQQLGQLAKFQTRPLLESLEKYQPCQEFYYLDRESVDKLDAEQRQNFMEQLDHSNHQEATVNGYCSLGGESAYVNWTAGQIEFRFEQYSFNFLTLYTKQADVSMVESPLTPKERLALESGEEIGSSIIRPNENYGMLSLPNADGGDPAGDCARSCTSPLNLTAYPACRSFDVIQIVNPKGSIRRICAYNSMSIKSAIAAKRADLIRIGEDKQVRVNLSHTDHVRVWHYEPRHGLMANYLDEVYEIQQVQKTREAEATRGLLHIGFFRLFCCIVVMLSLGITAGFTLGSRYLAGVRS